LVMLKSFQDLIPVLVPMFNMFKEIPYNGKFISDYSYYVMGQICVAEDYRGLNIVDKLYAKHKEMYFSKFDCCITEVSTSNARSMKAHKRVGFKTIHTFSDATDEWNILLWDWS
ncbi:MAG TPA: GNAT family N-acetyltransferase, partial [Cyclobacteriaceae bacterium]